VRVPEAASASTSLIQTATLKTLAVNPAGACRWWACTTMQARCCSTRHSQAAPTCTAGGLRCAAAHPCGCLISLILVFTDSRASCLTGQAHAAGLALGVCVLAHQVAFTTPDPVNASASRRHAVPAGPQRARAAPRRVRGSCGLILPTDQLLNLSKPHAVAASGPLAPRIVRGPAPPAAAYAPGALPSGAPAPPGAEPGDGPRGAAAAPRGAQPEQAPGGALPQPVPPPPASAMRLLVRSPSRACHPVAPSSLDCMRHGLAGKRATALAMPNVHALAN